MKTIYNAFISCFLLSVLLLFTGCSKKDDTTPASGSSVPLGTMTCKIDGKDYTFSLAFFTKDVASGITYITISGRL